MPAQHTLHVAVTHPLIRYVGEPVATGHYATASRVVRAALRLMIEHKEIEKRHGAISGQNLIA